MVNRLPLSSWLYHAYGWVLFSMFFLSVVVERGSDVLWVNGHHQEFLDNFFSAITRLGDGLIFLPIAIFTLFIRFRYTLIAAGACLFLGIFVSILKRILFPGAQRPVNLLDKDLLYFVPGVDIHSAHSFPSGHTATAFCAALLITLISKNKLVGSLCLIFAALVAYSRVYLLQHFLVDVAAGAVIGCFTTYFVWQVIESRGKPEWLDGHLEVRVKVSPSRTKSSSHI